MHEAAELIIEALGRCFTSSHVMARAFANALQVSTTGCVAGCFMTRDLLAAAANRFIGESNPMGPAICYSIVFLAAALLAWGASWAEMRGWRAAGAQHWTEQARELYPARVAALFNLVLIPSLVTLIMYVLRPELSWKVVALISYFGGIAGLYPMEHALYPHLPLKVWLHLAAATLVLRSITWVALVGAATLMPPSVGRGMFIVAGSYMLLQLLLHLGAGYGVMRILGILRQAGPRLSTIVNEVSSALGHPVRRTWELSSPAANAMAVITHGDLIFTTSLIEAAPDDELKAICAHEIGHLTESRWIAMVRIVGGLLLSGLIFVRPIHAAYHLEGVIAFVIALYLAWTGVLWLSRTMERRADKVAVTTQPSDSVYAHALERIHRVNLWPAVHRGRHAHTHPHLYDRLLAANFTPEYPRPLPPSTRPGSVTVFVVALVIIALAHFGSS